MFDPSEDDEGLDVVAPQVVEGVLVLLRHPARARSPPWPSCKRRTQGGCQAGGRRCDPCGCRGRVGTCVRVRAPVAGWSDRVAEAAFRLGDVGPAPGAAA